MRVPSVDKSFGHFAQVLMTIESLKKMLLGHKYQSQPFDPT